MMLEEYYSTQVLGKRNRRKTMSVFLTWNQKKYVIRETNAMCLYLLEFYYSKFGTPDYDYADDRVGRALEMNVTTVRDNRLKLEKAGLFKRKTIRNATAASHIILLGRDDWDDDGEEEEEIRELSWRKK